MGGATGARRFYRAGNHTLVCGAASSAAVTAADAQLVLKAYRVQIASSYSRTLLGSATGPLFNLGAVPNTFLAVSVMLALPEIILEPGESIQYSLDVLSAGTVVTGRIITLRFGLAVCSVTFPQLSVLADTDGASSGQGLAAGNTGKVLGVIGASNGFGDAIGTMGATSTTTGAAVGSVSVTGLASSVAAGVGGAVGSTIVTGIGGKILGAVGTVDIQGGGAGVPDGGYILDVARQRHIHRIALLHGLESGSPLTVTPNSRSAGGLVQSIEGTDTVVIRTTATPELSGNVETWIDGLAALHGITTELTVTQSSRVAAQVHQSISSTGSMTKVERV